MVGTGTAGRFRIAVIGKGMIGAAAARHLSQRTDGVVLIGPDEPAVRADHHHVFGSHYDEGRIYRILDPDPTWARLAERSIARYAEIEARSGIPFHAEVGMLAASATSPDFAERYASVGDALGVEFDRLSADELKRRFPYLQFGPNGSGAFEPTKAGHISPRRLVAAQTAAAERHGASIIREPVHTLTPADDGGVEISTASGQTVRAERALVATGGFANVHAVLPRPLDIVPKGRTIVKVEIGDTLRERLAGMPSLIVDGTAPLTDPYILPPIRYPDCRWYLKLGTGELGRALTTLDELGDWFRSPGADEDRDLLTQTIVSLIPDLAGAPVHTDTCVVTATASGYPYLERLADRPVSVAVGGNGKAAKSSDEIGRLAAELALTGSWQDDLPAEVFRTHFAGGAA